MLILVLHCWLISVTVGSETEDQSNPVLFTYMGQTALKTSYGHLIVPLKLQQLRKAFDRFADMEEAVIDASSWSSSSKTFMRARVERIKGKIDIITHLANKMGQETHFESFDQLNAFNESLFTSLNDNFQHWRPATTTTAPRSGRRKRNLEELVKLAGFGLRLFGKRICLVSKRLRQH